jgi:tRNA (guanine10-N2)-dimethyltransferase
MLVWGLDPVKLLFELSGEHPDLSLLELESVMGALQGDGANVTTDSSLAVMETHLDPALIGQRIALCHRVSEVLASGTTDSLMDAAGGLDLGGSIAVRCRKVSSSRDESCSEVSKQFGKILAESHAVDLANPSALVRIILGEESYLTIQRYEVDRGSFEERKAAVRPFSYPISLHPKFARLLVNMTGVLSGETLLDPFCGTGGVLIEAGLVGAHPIGSDLRADMVEGCAVNLKKLGIEADLFQADVADLQERVESVDAIATDPPYGRSTTMGGDIAGLYSKSFEVFSDILKRGGRLSIIVPSEDLMSLGTEHLELEASHSLRVHKSLTRHFCLFRN